MPVNAPLKVLLIESDSATVSALRADLAKTDSAEIVHTAAPADALRHVANDNTYDVALLGLHLPFDLGLHTLHELRRAAPWLPVVVLAPDGDADLRRTVIEAGAHECLLHGDYSGRELARVLAFAVERHNLRRFADTQVAILNSLPAHIALLDGDGNIIAVNDAWKRFGTANVLHAAGFGVGMNYLEVCDHAHGECASDAAAAAAGIRAVLGGQRAEFVFEYPCHSPHEKRWFRLMATSVHVEGMIHGAVIMHINITDRRLAEIERQRLVYDLNERVKELKGLHAAAVLLRDERLGSTELLERFTALLPGTMQYSDITAARVTFGAMVQSTPNFRLTPWRLSAGFEMSDGTRGGVEVVYLEERPFAGEGPFLEEERRLVDSLAEMLHSYFKRQLALDRLRRSEEEFRLLFQRNPHPMWVFDVDTLEFLAVNDRAVEHYGYSREEFLTMTSADIRPAEDLDKFRAYVADLAPPLQFNSIWRHRLKDGRLIRVEISSQSVEWGQRRARLVLALDVTERLEAEEALEASRRQLNSILSSVGEGIYGLDRDGNILFVNDAAARMLGYDASELIGKNSHFVLHHHRPDGAASPLAECPIHQTLRDGQPRERSDDICFRKDGSTFPVEYNCSPMRDSSGAISGGVVSFRDISERKASEEERAQAQALMRVASQVSKMGGWRVSVPDFAITWTDEIRAIYELAPGYTPGPEEVFFFYAPEHQETIRRVFMRCMHEGVPFDEECQLITAKDRRIWVRAIGEAVRDKSGQIRWIQGALQDITERKWAEESLRFSEERFRLLARATNDAIWDWDLVTNALWWNEGYETLFGYRRTEVEPSIDSWTTRIHPEDRERVVGDIFRVIESGGEFWSGEYRYLCKNGAYTYVLDRGHVIHDPSGRPVRMIGGMTDLTDRKNLETQLLQSQKMEAIGQLAGGVAHDFNNLLTIINGYSDLLLTMLPSSDGMHGMLANIREAGERATNLTRQLLAFSRKQLLAPQVLDLNTVVANFEKMLKRLIGEDIRIITVLRPSLARIKVDPGQLEQILINLVVNARDAMPSGGKLTIESANVTIPAATEGMSREVSPGNYVALIVEDTGKGMTPEVRMHIFEPFFTTKEPGKGTGLGLATVFGIVKQSDGYIEVHSEVGAGTRFTILFPAVAAEVRREARTDGPVPKGTETILLVEDESGVRDIARLVLEAQGYRVLAADNGRNALQLFEDGSDAVKLVITDVVMPEMSGREFIEHLRRRNPAIKVLFMSGYTDDAILRHGVSEATDAFIHKPFSPFNLARKVRDLLDAP